MTRRGGTIVFNGLPAGDVPAPIFDMVLKGLTIIDGRVAIQY